MLSSSRIKNTKRNIIWSYADYTISILFKFISRTVIFSLLGSEYLGLSSLFSSILQVLNMAELGFSTAIVYNLYKPIAENDTETVCGLLAFYRKIYRRVGSIILIIGVAVIPFLPNLIKKGYPDNINIYLLYGLYLANVVISYYLYAYKSSLLTAMQRMDLVKVAYSIVNISQCIIQILLLLLFKNYYLFVICTILGTASKNILAAYFAKKTFPQFECKGTISISVKNSIWKRVKGLLICKISGVTYTTFDSIILSSMIGLVPVAIYNNYLTIYSSVSGIIILIRHAMQASVGNSVASESIEKNRRDVYIWQFCFSIIAIWCSTCMLCLYQPFMIIWMGSEMMLSLTDVILLCILFTVSTVQHSYYLYLSGNGLWWELRWPYILSTITNLVLNVLLCRLWGVTGIILATLIATIVFGLIWQSSIIFKVYFKQSIFHFYKKQIVYFIVGIITSSVTYVTCSRILLSGFIGLAIKLILCIIIPPLCLYLFFFRTSVFNHSKKLFLRIIKR